jgi:hypothetical protein
MKRGDIVEIIWNDTHTPRNTDWMDEATYQKWLQDGMTIRSVGIVKFINDDFIGLVADTDIKTKTSERTVCRVINIGKGLIKESYILKRASLKPS